MPQYANSLKGTVHRHKMADGHPKSLKTLLAGRSLAGLAERAAATNRLARRVQAVVPAEIAPHIVGANLRERRLILIVDGPAWAARVRFESPAIRRALERDHELQVDGVTVKVSPRGSAV